MATDATGAPTPLGIPKYNTSADAPSGLGFNAAMDAIDALIAARVTKPASIAAGEVPVWNGSAFVRSSTTNIGPTSLGSGTPDATKFLRGDGTWALPSVANLLTLVYDNRLAADTSAGVGWDVSSIPGNPGDDLIIRIYSRFGSLAQPFIRFNNDSGANYWRVANGTLQSNMTEINLSSNVSNAEDDTTANYVSQWELTIGNYANTDFFHSASWAGGSVGRGENVQGTALWKSTAAITRVAFLPASGVVKAGSRITIWRRAIA